MCDNSSQCYITMHRQSFNSQQQNQLQEYQDQHHHQVQQQQQQQQIAEQRISRTEHTVTRQITQQRGQWSGEGSAKRIGKFFPTNIAKCLRPIFATMWIMWFRLCAHVWACVCVWRIFEFMRLVNCAIFCRAEKWEWKAKRKEKKKEKEREKAINL